MITYPPRGRRSSRGKRQSKPHNGRSAKPGEWHQRYQRATKCYRDLPLGPALLEALAAGLREWAAILPQAERDR